jgi:hypothetical protein
MTWSELRTTPSTRPFRAVDKGVVSEFINKSPLLLVQDAREYLENKYCNNMAFPAPRMNYRYLTPCITYRGYLAQITTSLDFKH